MLYKKHLTHQAIFFHRQTWVFFGIYVLARVLSFTTFTSTFAQGTIVFCAVMTLGILFFKKPQWALSLILIELFLGGSGHLFELGGLAIRSVFLLVFSLLYIIYTLTKKNKWHNFSIPHILFYTIIGMCCYVVLTTTNGVLQGNTLVAALQDLVPFLFFALLPPMFHLMQDKKGQEFFLRLCVVSVFCTALFSLCNEILFSSGAAIIHDHYYSWFRDVLMGKVTNMYTGFFRIVLPEHIFAIVALIISTSLVMKKEKHHVLWYGIILASSIILVLNLSRAYILGALIGLLPLYYRRDLLRYIGIVFAVTITMILSFFVTHFIASGGTSFGQTLFFDRAASILHPETEQSTYTRTTLLDPIQRKISQAPFFGSGLGSTIRFQPPNSSKIVTTRQFDWGYLEIIAELGFVGLGIFFFFLSSLLYTLVTHIKNTKEFHGLYVGILGVLVSLLFIEIFTPIFTHVLGIFFLTLCCVLVTQKHTPLDIIVNYFYRLFRRTT